MHSSTIDEGLKYTHGLEPVKRILKNQTHVVAVNRIHPKNVLLAPQAC